MAMFVFFGYTTSESQVDILYDTLNKHTFLRILTAKQL